MLHLSTTTIWRHVRKGKIKAVKIGRTYRIRQSDFEDMLQAAEVMVPSPSTLLSK